MCCLLAWPPEPSTPQLAVTGGEDPSRCCLELTGGDEPSRCLLWTGGEEPSRWCWCVKDPAGEEPSTGCGPPMPVALPLETRAKEMLALLDMAAAVLLLLFGASPVSAGDSAV